MHFICQPLQCTRAPVVSNMALEHHALLSATTNLGKVQ